MTYRSEMVCLLVVLGSLVMVACQPVSLTLDSGSASTTPPPTDTARPPIEVTLREAFRTSDPIMRVANVLGATDSFLRDEAVRASDDSVASIYFTSVAFSSGRLTLSEPAILRRRGNLAVVALPEGLGLYLWDLGEEAGTPPLEISRWTVGLSGLDTIWGQGEVGISFVTLGEDGTTTAHYALATKGSAWQVAWFSDEVPEWWFNARGGTLTVAPDLSQIILTGEAPRTTETFYEQPGEPRRTFRIVWLRERDNYVMASPVENYPHREMWLWQVAVPSPYATLVEFVERLQLGDEEGAARLTGEPTIVPAAIHFGLSFPDRRFQVVSQAADRLVMRDLQGAFLVTFSEPQRGDAPWLITSLAPLGVEPATSDTGQAGH